MKARLPPLVLKPRKVVASPQERWIAALFVLAVFSAVIGTFYLLFGNPFGDWDRDSFAKAFEEVRKKMPAARQIEGVGLVVVTALHLWYLRRASMYERLHLDMVGIRYLSPLPMLVRVLRPDWSLQWSQVREMRIVVPKAMFHPNLIMIEIDAGPIKRKLQALHWAVDASGAESVPWRERFFSGFRPTREKDKALQQIEQSSIVRYAREAGVSVTTTDRGAPSGFSLEKHRHALVASVLVLALLCYAVVDLAVNEEIHAVQPPLVLFILAGALADLVATVWLGVTGVPRAETLGVALLLGAAVGVALYPGSLRLNQMTDSEGLRTYEYRLTEYVVFSPSAPLLPVLRFPADADYWGQFKLGTTHSFELRKGGLGFYQVNMGPVHDKMREYFIRKRAGSL